MIIAYASAETRFVPLYSPWAADMQVKGQSGAADKMEVNQAKQEHLLALKGTAGVYFLLEYRGHSWMSDRCCGSFINTSEIPAVAVKDHPC